MEPRLPTLKDFKAIEAPPQEPERWWLRYFSYVSMCLAATAICSGIAFFQASGVTNDPQNNSMKEYLDDSTAYNNRVYTMTILAGSASFIVTAIFCIRVEARAKTKKENA
jgi:hypothetical protein